MVFAVKSKERIPMPMNFKAYIFDLDGTVLDSMGVWRNIDIDFLGKRGLPFTEEYAKALSSMKLNLAAEYTIDLYALKEKPQDIISEWLEAAREAFAYKVGLKPYAKEFLELLHSKGIPAAIATTSQKELYVPAVQRNGIEGLFGAVVDSDMVSTGKETPEIFLHAARLLKTEPSDCLVFEDTFSGISSAKSAGFKVAAILDKNNENLHSEIRKIADFAEYDFERFYKKMTVNITM